ncbi:MAG TPA: transcription elongation factor GreA [Candidatus Magasanikbacteria bacterium]|nr:transcription elongation factor GreA [Candidatus Magasanikbacteria bacterium]
MSPQYMTEEKIEKLKVELKNLKEEKIPGLAKRIDDARQMGDLSENAEYHAAREDMAWAQTRVKELGYLIDNAEVISTSAKNGEVQVGSRIVVSNKGKKKEYTIVGAQEASPIDGKISNESPLGSAFLGAKKGQKITVNLPAGPQEYKIEEVS